MIQIINKADCCGCSACAQRCPKQCITMQSDHEGFLYPIIDTNNCIDCGLCEKVCPVINQSEAQTPLKVYAAINKNENIRQQSSSGGIFTVLAHNTIARNGVVFGVKFNKQWEVVFDYTESIDGIAQFRGSKYVQATVGDAFINAEKFLKEGREVLFCGTPCQIAGLKKFLRKEYSNLLTVDIICHGVPSPKVWNRYLQETCSKLLKKTEITEIETISFRSKITGWRRYSFLLKARSNSKKDVITYTQQAQQNTYLRGFIADLYLRPSCHNCPSKLGKSHSDITIADFWGIENIDKEINYENGVTAIFINNSKGEEYCKLTGCDIKEFTYEDVVKYNSARLKSSKMHKDRENFFKNIDKKKSIISLIDKYTKITLSQRIFNKIKRIFKL